MRIKLGNGNFLFTTVSDEGKIISTCLADFSGKINFQKEVQNFLRIKGRGKIEKIPGLENFFIGSSKKKITPKDIVELAERLEKRRRR